MPVALACLAAGLFGQAFIRLRRRGRRDHAPWSRPLVFGAAVAVGLLALVSPLDQIAEEDLLSAHMLQHVLIGDLVPVLLVVALRGPLLFFFLPTPALRLCGRVRPVRAVLRFVLRPEVSFAVWAGALAVWHVPALYDAALTHPLLHELEHASFLLGGLLVWVQLVDPARRNALSRNGKLAYAGALLICGQALANVLLLRFSPLYPAYGDSGGDPLGFSPLGDQRAAAVVMMVEQLATVGTFVILALRSRARAPLVLAPDRHPFAA